jgi:hypothetical protein
MCERKIVSKGFIWVFLMILILGCVQVCQASTMLDFVDSKVTLVGMVCDLKMERCIAHTKFINFNLYVRTSTGMQLVKICQLPCSGCSVKAVSIVPDGSRVIIYSSNFQTYVFLWGQTSDIPFQTFDFSLQDCSRYSGAKKIWPPTNDYLLLSNSTLFSFYAWDSVAVQYSLRYSEVVAGQTYTVGAFSPDGTLLVRINNDISGEIYELVGGAYIKTSVNRLYVGASLPIDAAIGMRNGSYYMMLSHHRVTGTGDDVVGYYLLTGTSLTAVRASMNPSSWIIGLSVTPDLQYIVIYDVYLTFVLEYDASTDNYT